MRGRVDHAVLHRSGGRGYEGEVGPGSAASPCRNSVGQRPADVLPGGCQIISSIGKRDQQREPVVVSRGRSRRPAPGAELRAVSDEGQGDLGSSSPCVPTFAPRMMGIAPWMGSARPTHGGDGDGRNRRGRRLDQDDVPRTPTLQSDPRARGEGEHGARRVAAQTREAAADDAHGTDQQVDQPGDAEPAEGRGPRGKVGAVVRPAVGCGFRHGPRLQLVTRGARGPDAVRVSGPAPVSKSGWSGSRGCARSAARRGSSFRRGRTAPGLPRPAEPRENVTTAGDRAGWRPRHGPFTPSVLPFRPTNGPHSSAGWTSSARSCGGSARAWPRRTHTAPSSRPPRR